MHDKTAIIMSTSRGIGWAVARALTTAGANA
jgi:NAD(P)-dependent dehydrogenase (short-subunit alcohol dehydrogenase family)